MAVYVFVAVGCFLLLVVVFRARRRRATAPVVVPLRTTVPSDAELRNRLLARLAFDMRAPLATAAATVVALRDAPSPQPVLSLPPTFPSTGSDGYEISWAP
ncbi:hypothetical protein FZI91_04045 [Mycobacterium sp. CBMA271]|uniref:hypothetical protein n=1 Tax=unclassified Mycobacteroides TaxID=2618759 RepID=UPI0012DC0118|nr:MULTISPECIES: hypothetical protein [unclassified Mycobacteroides]MUM20878.1 hypothetical protein [Mycobacteroides sp. CBMA 271]